MATRFPVHDVTPKLNLHASFDLDLTHSWETEVDRHSKFRLHKSSTLPEGGNVLSYFTHNNQLLEAAQLSFFEHVPLRISPNVIWITILQGLAVHMQQYAEEQRSKFISFEGVKEISIERPDISLGEDDNDWVGAIEQLTAQVRQNIHHNNHYLLETQFTTTTIIDQVAISIAIMDIVQHFFSFQVVGGCGIPWIELTGTVEDWRTIRMTAEKIGSYGLEWWMESLLPVLDEFVFAMEGLIHEQFWRAIVFSHGGSDMLVSPGGTGWIQALFPYMITREKMERNAYLNAWQDDHECLSHPDQANTRLPDGMERSPNMLSPHCAPSSINHVPFQFMNLQTRKTTNMQFASGLIAIVQAQDGAIEVKTGWAILEDLSNHKDGNKKDKSDIFKVSNDQKKKCCIT
jgi:hypothetical protein